ETTLEIKTSSSRFPFSCFLPNNILQSSENGSAIQQERESDSKRKSAKLPIFSTVKLARELRIGKPESKRIKNNSRSY
ncbi:hypothetical protein ACQP3J_33005, partial [Escherichia coli]